MVMDKKLVQEYLKKLSKVEELKKEIEAIEVQFKTYVEATGEETICNLLKVSASKNPPKLVAIEGDKVTDAMRQELVALLKDTAFVKQTISIEVKKLLEAKDKKDVKVALKKVGLNVVQTEKIGFERIVSPLKK